MVLTGLGFAIARPTTRSRSFVFATAAILGIASLGLWAAPAQAAGDGNLEGELTWMGQWSTEDVQPVLDAWAEVHPEVPVTYQEVPFAELNSVVGTRLGSGDADPDIYNADQPRIPDLVRRGWLMDITDQVGDVSDKYLSAALEASSADGRLYALPVSTTSQMMAVNLDHLKAAGIDPPTANPEDRWTWEQTVEAAKAAQAAGAQWGLQLEQVSRIYQLQPLPESLGGGDGLAGDDNGTADFTNDGWIEAMNFWAAIHEEGVAPRGITPEQTAPLWFDGNLTFMVHSPGWLPVIAEKDLDFEYCFAAHPYFEAGEPVTPTGAWSLGINPNSDNAEAAIEFIKFANEDPVGSRALHDGTHEMPAYIDTLVGYALQTEPYQKECGGTTVGDLIQYELANTAVIRAPTPEFIAYEELTGNALEDIRNGLPVESTLEQLEADMNAVLDSE